MEKAQGKQFDLVPERAMDSLYCFRGMHRMSHKAVIPFSPMVEKAGGDSIPIGPEEIDVHLQEERRTGVPDAQIPCRHGYWNEAMSLPPNLRETLSQISG